MKKLYGVTTAMVTPFNNSDEVDLAAMRRHTDFLIERGVHCLYPTGTTGEVHLLSVAERKKIVETVIDQAKGRVTIYVHAGALMPKDTVELVRHAESAGADGAGVMTPIFFPLNESELEAYFVDVANSVSSDFPIYLYNIPQLSANDLKPATIERVVDRCPNVIGVKYSSMDFQRISDYLKIKGGEFSLLIGADKFLVPGLSMGCDGTISGNSNVCPEWYVAIYNAVQKGDFEKARRLQSAANEIGRITLAGNIPSIKAALRARGMTGGHVRRPLMDLPAQRVLEIEEGMKELLANFEKVVAGS